MAKLIILTNSFFDFQKACLKIGGLETYIKDLALLGIALGRDTYVYQIVENKEYIPIDYEGVKICPIIAQKEIFKSKNQSVFEAIYKRKIEKGDFFIIASDQMDIKSNASNIITIQHGIAFDIPGYMIKGFWGKTHCLQFVNKMLRCIKNVRRFYNTRNTVCVDYNYYNWFRTLGTIYEGYNIKVIPNYSSSCISVEEFEKKNNSKPIKRRIVFARRFIDYRGAILFSDVIRALIKERQDVEVTFAGNGPLEDFLHNKFRNNPNVLFTSFSTNESVLFHKEFDIAVIPTIYSEGTSLSLCEAMAAGCIPIATHVGGMTNMVLDEYNGYLSYPSFEELFEKIKLVLDLDNDTIQTLRTNAYNSARIAFCKDKWEDSWISLLSNMIKV